MDKKLKKHVIFIGAVDGYDRKAKKLQKEELVGLSEIYEAINADIFEVTGFPDRGMEKFKILCDEEGILNGKPIVINTGISKIHGDIVIVKEGPDNFEGLTPEEIKRVRAWIHNTNLTGMNDIQEIKLF